MTRDDRNGLVVLGFLLLLVLLVVLTPWARENCSDQEWYTYKCGEREGPAYRDEDRCIQFKDGDRLCSDQCVVTGEIVIEAKYQGCGWIPFAGELISGF